MARAFALSDYNLAYNLSGCDVPSAVDVASMFFVSSLIFLVSSFPDIGYAVKMGIPILLRLPQPSVQGFVPRFRMRIQYQVPVHTRVT